jgi:hypothetical protein
VTPTSAGEAALQGPGAGILPADVITMVSPQHLELRLNLRSIGHQGQKITQE